VSDDVPQFVRDLYAAWARGDFTSVDWASPDIEFRIADGPAPESWVGREAMAAGWGEVLGVWDGLRAHAEEFRVLEDGRILVLMHNTGRGKSSGLDLGEMTTRGANVMTLDGDQVSRLAIYFDRNRALADLADER
jgi:hypothetical protein